MEANIPERNGKEPEKAAKKENESDNSLSSSSVNPKPFDKPSHGNIYEELLDAKEIQSNPLSIPITSGPDASLPPSNASLPPSSSSRPGPEGGPEPDPRTDRQTSLGPEIARSAGQSGQSGQPTGSPPSSGQRQEEVLTHHYLPVQAVAEEITSVYHPVASAEVITETRPSPTEIKEQEEQIALMKLRHQRFKLIKLAVLLAILIVVVAVPLSIRNQRLATPSTSQPDSSTAVKPCFQSHEELESAVDDYLAGGARRDGAVTAYGDPIGSWCVSLVQGMDFLFSTLRNPKSADFDEPLFYWDVSRVLSMREMFRGAAAFSQPLGSWNVSQVDNMTMMFTGASSFRQDLCIWRSLLSNNTAVQDMFLDTDCDSQEDPELGPFASGPFCTPCKRRLR